MAESNISYAQRASKTAALLEGKWTVEILCALREHPTRLSELKRSIPLASKESLTASLRYFESVRIVQRRDLSSSVLHVEYSLTDEAREHLIPLLDCLAKVGVFLGSSV